MLYTLDSSGTFVRSLPLAKHWPRRLRNRFKTLDLQNFRMVEKEQETNEYVTDDSSSFVPICGCAEEGVRNCPGKRECVEETFKLGLKERIRDKKG